MKNKMNTKRRMQKISNFIKRGIIGTVLVVLLLAIAGTIYQTAASEADQRSFPAPGNLIDVGGFKMHINCMGEGSPTVILEAMSGGASPYWGWVQPEIAKKTRVCSYDRAGFYWSESDPEPQSLARTVQNMHTLLVNANISGPYVLVGHSIGGVYMRQFAADYPGQVAGVVLLDVAHPQQFKQYPELFAEADNYLNILNGMKILNRIGVGHAYFALGGEVDFSELSEPQKSQVKAFWASPRYFEAQSKEIRAGREIWSDALKLGGLRDLPLMVISRGLDLDHDWIEYQNELATLSTNNQYIIVEGANHTGLVFNPDHAQVVSQAILQVVGAAQTGARLSP